MHTYIGDLIRQASRDYDRTQRALEMEWELRRNRLIDDDCLWDDKDIAEFDEEGYCITDYVKAGSEPLTYWEEMVARII